MDFGLARRHGSAYEVIDDPLHVPQTFDVRGLGCGSPQANNSTACHSAGRFPLYAG